MAGLVLALSQSRWYTSSPTERERGEQKRGEGQCYTLCATGHVRMSNMYNTDQTCKIMCVLSTIIKDRMDRSNNSWVEMWTDVTLK